MPTHDDILFGQIKLWQPDVGPRVNMDTVLLASFVRKSARRTKFVELGSAAGAVSLLLAQRFPEPFHITGVEIQPELVALAERNRQETGLSDRVKFLCGDLRDRTLLPPESFDGLVINPPYLCPVNSTGKSVNGSVASQSSRAIARQGVLTAGEGCTLEDISDAGVRLLKGHGLFFAVFRTDRLASFLVTLESRRLIPKRLKIIYPRPNEASNLFLVECVKDAGAGMVVEPPLFVLDGDPSGSGQEHYTPELLKAYTLNESC